MPDTVDLELRVTPEVKRSIEKAARAMGVPVSLYVTTIHITHLIAQTKRERVAHG